jgi:hypothetical protein
VHCPHHNDAFSNPRMMRVMDQNVELLFLGRACHQLSQTTLAMRWTAARKFRLVFS